MAERSDHMMTHLDGRNIRRYDPLCKGNANKQCSKLVGGDIVRLEVASLVIIRLGD